MSATPRVYDIGARLEMKVTIRNASSGALFAPVKVTCHFKDGDGTVAEVNVTNPTVGVYVAFGTIEAEGDGGYAFDAFDGDGKSLGAVEVEFRVRARAVAR
jgi:hypothetical protein